MTSALDINGKKLGNGEPTYIVAEMSANHGGDLGRAKDIIKAAKEVGADAIKVQTYTADTITIPCDNEYFRIGKGSIWAGRQLYELYEEAHTPWEWHPILKETAESAGIDLFSTAFDHSSIDFLEKEGVPVHKIASFELVDIPLIQRAAGTGKPLVLSTGMATLSEIEVAVQAARDSGAAQIALLKCTSAYPAREEDMNLRAIPFLQGQFDCPVGLSDHSMGHDVACTAVALGACMVEKHFTISRADKGPDSQFSMEPDEFASMVTAIRRTERMLGNRIGPSPSEEASLVFRRSLFVVQDMKAGDVFTTENVRSIRPGYGLRPRMLESVLGKRCTCDVTRGTPLSVAAVETVKHESE